MSSTKQWVVLIIVSLSLLLVTMDLGILFVALPSLSADLGASATEKIWIINAYTLLVAGLLPVCGALGDRKGHKKVFVWGMAIFGVASLICAYSPNPETLIAGRALLAIGAAFMLPTTMPIIHKTFETEKQRALAIGIWSAMAATGAAAGPLLGGLLLEKFWWGSVFLINVPFVLIGVLISLRVIPEDYPASEERIDLLSALLVTIGLAGPMYTVSSLSAHGGGNTDHTLAWAVGIVGLAALTFFVRRQLGNENPLVDIRLFKNRKFTSAIIAGSVTLLSLAGYELVLIQKMQYVNGNSPLWSSLYIFPISIVALFAGPITGWFIPKLGYMRVMIWSVMLTGLGMLAAVWLVNLESYLVVAVPLAIAGFGLGAVMTASASIVMMSVPPHEIGSASSLQHVSYQIGHGLGVGILGSLITYVYNFSYVGGNGAVDNIARSGIDEAFAVAENLDGATKLNLLETARHSFEQSFLVVAAIAGLLLVITAIFLKFRNRKALQIEENAAF